eukprot:4094955-Heterocapsa_arctica.AAC.1
MTECIFALGYIHQTKHCKALEGIMDLVVHLENQLRAPAPRSAEISAQQEMEMNQPVARREFHIAMNMLKDMNNCM